MKKSQLKNIIKEEIQSIIKEQQLEFQFETFEDLQEKAKEIDGYKDLPEGGFSLPIQSIMLDKIGTYEIRKVDDETVNVIRFDKRGNKEGEKDTPLEVIKGYIDKYKTW